MHSYLIETDDYYSSKLLIQKEIEKEGFLDALSSVYDLNEGEIDSVLEDLRTYGLLSPKKVIIVQNIQEYNIENKDSHYDSFIHLLETPDPDKLLFLIGHLNHTTKLAKDLSKHCKVLTNEFSTKAFIKQCLKDYDISQDAINLLDEYSLGDFTKIKSECDKLKNYRYDEKKITIDDIKELVSKKLGDPRELTFQFSRSVGQRDRVDALKKYQELLSYQVEPLSIIGLLASQIRIIYQVKLLAKKRLSDKEIGEMLGEKDFRIKKTRELISYYTEEDCLNLMKKLSDMDLKIKTTDVNSKQELELFIINL